MCPKFLTGSVSELVGYTYPKLHKGKEWYVDFYARDPVTNKMRRKKYSIGGELRTSEKTRRATEIITVVSRQLMSGWNPWVTADESRGYVLFETCLDRYIEYVNRMERKKTRQSYSSRVNILREFIAQQTEPIKYVYQFDVAFCNDFIDWIYLDRESTPRTRNNYRGWLFSFSEFLVNRKHIAVNPVEHIKVLVHICCASLNSGQTTGRLTHRCGNALTEASGRECSITLRYHPCRKVWYKIEAFQRYYAGYHQVTCREERILQIVHHRLVCRRHCRKVVVLDIQHDVEEQKDVKTHEVEVITAEIKSQKKKEKQRKAMIYSGLS